MTFVSPERGADATAVMLDHLTSPLAAGAQRTVFPPASDGTVALPPARRPTLLVGLRVALGGESLTVTATLAGAPLPPVRFAPWSEAGSTLILGAGGEASAAASLSFAAATPTMSVLPAALADWLEAVLIEGTTGRVVALLGAETVRLRREMGVLSAMRRLRDAEDDALDRVGAELGVPRLESTPAWEAARREIVSTPAREADDAYRGRLAVWRPFMAPTPAAVRSLLTAVDPRLSVTEPGQPLAIATRLIAVGGDGPRLALLARLRLDRLIFLQPGAPGDAVHAARPQPPDRRSGEAAMRTRLADKFPAAADAAVAPRLAECLDRAARILRALGGDPVPVIRAQDSAGGSRFELGLGVAVTLPAVTDADALRTTLMDAGRAPGVDAEAEALIAAARDAAPAAGDRTLSWLWRAAGLATAHRLDTDTLYLSHLPTAGLTIEAPGTLAPGASAPVRAVFNAPGDPGMTAALAVALDRAEAAAPATFTRVTEADTAAAIGPAQDLPPVHPAVSVLAAAGLPVPAIAASTVAALTALAPELRVVLRLDAALAGQVRTGAAAAVAPLSEIVAALRTGGVISLLPLVTATDVLLVAGAASLPVAGINLGERRATGVRWSVESLGGTAEIARVGFGSVVSARAPGLIAVVALGYVRDGAPDPYEIRVEMPAGAVLDLAGYERVMNALERSFPVGVEVNTWSLRTRHVDLDGDGLADPLPPTLARHYRHFRMPRLRGMEEPADATDPTADTMTAT